MENPEMEKTNVTFTVDSAVWYIEALLNYNYSVITDSTQIYIESSQDSIFSDFEVSGDLLTFSDVRRIYKEVVKKIETDLKQMNTDKKRVDLVDVTFRDGKFVSYLYYRFEEESKVVVPPIFYQITGDWQWGRRLGNCDQTILYYDMTFEMNKWLASREPVFYNVIWTDVHVYGVSQYPYTGFLFTTVPYNEDMGQFDLYKFVSTSTYYRLFQHIDDFYNSDFRYCMPDIEATDYCNKILYLKQVIQNNLIPETYSIKKLKVFASTCFGTPTYNMHCLSMTIGHPISNIQQ